VDLLVSLITAFYILMDKDRLCAQIKKIGYSIFPREKNESLIYWTRQANRLFAGFITGKIIDSAIIGVICYLGMIIFKMEYPLLISLIIGVTNIIPFFGPFIGWAPCSLILLLVNPMSALWFTLFILFLQQLDGNVIGPHILGDSVGVSALSIMIAIIIGYMSGITGKIVGGQINYVLGMYCFNLTVVSFDLMLYFANKRREKRLNPLEK
jgi:predicted PurR-regulated permease PerM